MTNTCTIEEYIDQCANYFESITGEKCSDIVAELPYPATVEFFSHTSATCMAFNQSPRMAALIMYAGIMIMRMEVSRRMTKH